MASFPSSSKHRIGYRGNGSPYVVNVFTVSGIYEYALVDVYEPGELAGRHSNITSFTNTPGVNELGVAWWGRIGSRRLTPEQDAMPVNEKRFAMVREHYKDQHREARALILMAYPEFDGRLSDDMLSGAYRVYPKSTQAGAVEAIA